MPKAKSQGLDVLGTQPLAKAVDRVTKGSVEVAQGFLTRICYPAADEFGLLLQDQVKWWRAKNGVRIAEKAAKLVPNNGNISAHPRLVSQILEHGSWTDDEIVQDMWAGLLASSCTEGVPDDSNILFTSILQQMTSLEVRIVAHACEAAPKFTYGTSGLPFTGDYTITSEDLKKLTGVPDIHRLDRELDHLRSLELIRVGFGTDSTKADLTVSPLALHLYVRGKGFRGSPVEFWGLKPRPPPGSQPQPA